MARRAVHGKSQSLAFRGTIIVFLAGFSVPVLAASGLNMSCDDADSGPADFSARAPVAATPDGDHEPLILMKAEANTGIDPSRDLGSMLGKEYGDDSGIVMPQQKAVAEALERRRNGHLSAADDDEMPEPAPSIDTALPGIGDAESMIYRREMYRTDI